jgi:hypothetical protein
VLDEIAIHESIESATYIKRCDASGEGAGVEAHENIGGDAAAAVYGPFFRSQSTEGGTGMLFRGIAVEDFAVMEAFQDLIVIVMLRPVGV